MDCYVGASTGALKGISLKDNSFYNVNSIKSLDPKKDEIIAMIWTNGDQTDLLTAQLDRQLKILDCENSKQTNLFVASGGEGTIKGLHLTNKNDIITCVESGVVKIWSDTGKEKHSWNVGNNITSMNGSNNNNLIVTGGTENLTKTWDIETGKQTWSAKNVPLDKLQIPIKVLTTSLLFVEEGNQILEATKLHEMRLYDPREQRRPVKKISFMESPITSISHCYRDHHIIAANAIGEMGLFDLRSRVNPVWKYKGHQAGSIRSIDGHPTAPYMVSCGIDRFVRVHEVETRKLVHKIYCKTRLNKVVMRRDLSILKQIKKEEDEDWEQIKGSDDEETDEGSNSDEESSENDVWDELSNNNPTRKRKDDSEDVPEPSKKKKTGPSRKRKDSDSIDEIVEEPTKKSKKGEFKPKPIEIKEEVESEEDEEPVPVKRRKLTKNKTK